MRMNNTDVKVNDDAPPRTRLFLRITIPIIEEPSESTFIIGDLRRVDVSRGRLSNLHK